MWECPWRGEQFPERKKVSSSALLRLIHKATVASSASPMATLYWQCRRLRAFFLKWLYWHCFMHINICAAVKHDMWASAGLLFVLLICSGDGDWAMRLVAFRPGRRKRMSGTLKIDWAFWPSVTDSLFFRFRAFSSFCLQQPGQQKKFISCWKCSTGFLKSISEAFA
jgi:hypothetical protein